MIELRRYQLADQSTPVTDWLQALRDVRARAQIEVRLRRVSTGNFGDCKSVGEGVSELRINRGPGYRVYFGWDGKLLVILLGGGTKKRQQSDIQSALRHWRAYKARKAAGRTRRN